MRQFTSSPNNTEKKLSCPWKAGLKARYFLGNGAPRSKGSGNVLFLLLFPHFYQYIILGIFFLQFFSDLLPQQQQNYQTNRVSVSHSIIWEKWIEPILFLGNISSYFLELSIFSAPSHVQTNCKLLLPQPNAGISHYINNKALEHTHISQTENFTGEKVLPQKHAITVASHHQCRSFFFLCAIWLFGKLFWEGNYLMSLARLQVWLGHYILGNTFFGENGSVKMLVCSMLGLG